MTRPRVVAEVKRDVPNRPPPPNPVPHKWLSGESASLFEEQSCSGRGFEVYLSADAERRIRRQSIKAAPGRLEVMGLLLGEVGRWEGRDYVVVRGVGTTDLENTQAKVRFDPDALPGLFKELDNAGFDYVVVGWYHSHPGHTCFLSRTDMHTQRTLFDQPYHLALVIDPINEEIKAFRLSGDGYSEIPFALIREDEPRIRTLKSETKR
jgi:26S proteasome regulatory subunit N11